MGVEIVVPVAGLLTISAICAIVMYYRFRTRQELQLTIRAAIESGQNLSAEVLEQLTASLHAGRNDLRRGVIAIGTAFVALALTFGAAAAIGPLLGLSAFPLFVGLAYVALWFFNRDDKARG